MIPAVAYARFSSDNQRDESIDAQVRAIKYFAQNTGYEIVRIYTDKALSGTTTDRPQFRQMISDSLRGDFEAVIVHKLDRFSRNSTDAVVYERELKINGVQLVSVSERLDASPEGQLMKAVIFGINQFYSANLAREVMKGLKENAYSAKHTGGKPPLGYDVLPDLTYAINPWEAEAVKLIFEMYDADAGYSAIIDALSAKGFKTKRGLPFGKNSLYEILRNEKYTGLYVYNRVSSKDARGKVNRHKQKDEQDLIKVQGGMPQIIEVSLFERVRKRMEENRRRQASFKAKTNYLLSGILYCGHCKSAMTGETRRYKGREYSYYVCAKSKGRRICDKRNIKKDDIEAYVLGQLNAKIFNPKSIDEVCLRIYESYRSGGVEDKKILLTSRISECTKQISNCVAAVAKGTDVPEIHDMISELSAEKKALQLQLYEIDLIGGEGKSLEEIKNEYGSMADVRKLSPEALRRFVRLFVKRVYVYDGPDGNWRVRILVSREDITKEVMDQFGELNSITGESFVVTEGSALPLPQLKPVTKALRFMTGFFALRMQYYPTNAIPVCEKSR